MLDLDNNQLDEINYKRAKRDKFFALMALFLVLIPLARNVLFFLLQLVYSEIIGDHFYNSIVYRFFVIVFMICQTIIPILIVSKTKNEGLKVIVIIIGMILFVQSVLQVFGVFNFFY